MKAVFGKLSFVCFITYWVFTIFRINYEDERFERYVVETNMVLFLILVCGLVLSIIGIKRNESLKIFCVASFIMHMAWLSLSLCLLRKVFS